ncbi:MAG TPA: zinc ribbon domain-containing protein [Allosphingosinicella sp.]
MSDQCPNCRREIDLHERFCPFCTADAKPPNVRFAERTSEAAALAGLEAAADSKVAAAGTQVEQERLVELARTSELVINRGLRSLAHWVEGEDELYVNFYKLKERGVRMANDVFNRQRISAENTISPTFADQLVIGALTVDGRGMDYYGGYSVLVREEAIRTRATVFWENPFEFNKRMKIVSGQDPPEGYRAVWGERHRLASAKLSERLTKGADDGDLAKLMMGPDRSARDCDFIEVHVWQDIHADAIRAVVPPDTIAEADRSEWEHLREKLVKKGAVC